MHVARLVRASFLSLREREFVEAARALGAGDRRLIVRHILPNAMGPIIVAATLGVAGAILLESTLSYLGYGVQPPVPTWGNMLQNAQGEMYQAPWLGDLPGLDDLRHDHVDQFRRGRPARRAGSVQRSPRVSSLPHAKNRRAEAGVVGAALGAAYWADGHHAAGAAVRSACGRSSAKNGLTIRRAGSIVRTQRANSSHLSP